MRRAFGALGALLILATAVGFTFYVRPRIYLLTFAGVGLAAFGAYCVAWLRGTRLANLAVSLVVTGLCLSVLDPYVALRQAKSMDRYEGSWSYRYHYVGDNDLGYALPADVTGESIKYHGDRLLYDVIYSIDSHGNRVTPVSADPSADNVLFMGDSFTFGMGLNDADTLPRIFSELTDKRFNVVNLGVPAYGLHQVVRQLEIGRIDPLLRKGKRYIIYSAIADHARRAISAYSWAVEGPAYQLGPDGIATYRGNLHGIVGGMMTTTASRSAFLATYVLPGFLAQPDVDPLPLYIGLIRRAQQLAQKKYHAKFIMIFWDDDYPAVPSVKAALDAAKIPYIAVTSIIPDLLTAKPGVFRLATTDTHPTGAANRLIAAYLAKRFAGGTIDQ